MPAWPLESGGRLELVEDMTKGSGEDAHGKTSGGISIPVAGHSRSTRGEGACDRRQRCACGTCGGRAVQAMGLLGLQKGYSLWKASTQTFHFFFSDIRLLRFANLHRSICIDFSDIHLCRFKILVRFKCLNLTKILESH